MRTIKNLLAAVLSVVMIVCMSASAFAAYEELVYEDVSEMYGTTLSDVNTQYIRFVDKLGLVSAHKNGSFDPAAMITRGEALKIAYRMLHYNYDELENYESAVTEFDEMDGGDITDTDLIKPYIAWGIDYQLVNAEYVPENKFEPNKYITGEEFITLITKAAGVSMGEDDADVYEEFQSAILEGAELDASSETVNREQAAVVVARAMIYDSVVGSIDPEMFNTFEDFEGNRLDCMATKIYGCNSTELTIRATRNRPMNYRNVTRDLLLSNGVMVDVGADLSEMVGFNISIIYLDKDGSGTFTEDEELITYTLASPIVSKGSLNDMAVENYTKINGTIESNLVSIYTNTTLYLNDDHWPADDIYDLTKQVKYVNNSKVTPFEGRPNLEVTFIQHSSTENADIVLAYEWIPGKLMMVNDNYVSVYSYYDGKTYVYEDNNVSFSSIVNPKAGDYVNFYISGERIFVKGGNTVEMKQVGQTTVEKRAGIVDASNAEAKGYYEHALVNVPSIAISDLKGTVVAVLDVTEKSYIALEEKKATEEIIVEVIKATMMKDGENVEVQFRELATGKEQTVKASLSRIASADGVIKPGSMFTFYMTDGEQAVLNGISPVTLNVIETEDYFITDGEVKYLKTKDYVSDTPQFKSGKATLYIDRYEGVWASYVA
jgi:hypothetical protein